MNENVADISVLVADRYALFSQGLIGMLRDTQPDWSFAQASTFAEVLDHLDAVATTLVLIDLQLPGLGGVEGISSMRQLFPGRAIAVLSENDDRASIIDCLSAGALGYIQKSACPAQFVRAIDTILAGGVFAPATLTAQPQTAALQPWPKSDINVALLQLTERQRDVFRLLAEGCSTKVIARRLNLAVGTVKVHLAGIYRTLGARNRLEAVTRVNGDVAPALLRGAPRPPVEHVN